MPFTYTDPSGYTHTRCSNDFTDSSSNLCGRDYRFFAYEDYYANLYYDFGLGFIEDNGPNDGADDKANGDSNSEAIEVDVDSRGAVLNGNAFDGRSLIRSQNLIAQTTSNGLFQCSPDLAADGICEIAEKAELNELHEKGVETGNSLADGVEQLYKDAIIGAVGIKILGRAVRAAGAPNSLLGRLGRDVLGETRLRGLNQNRSLAELTDTDIRKTFADSPLTLSNHAISRILDPRTRALGAQTPNDIARLLNKGVTSDGGAGLIRLQHGSLEAIINPVTKTIVTIKPVR